MQAFREQDFDKMAERVVDQFMGGAKLADAATSEAMGGLLNPDQIARLVQAANTMAFLRLMDQQKAQGGADMTHEFDPIDARQIMQQIVGQTPEHSDFGGQHGTGSPGMDPDAGPDAGPLPDEMGAHHAPPQFGEGEAQQAMGNDEPKGPPIDDDNDGPFPKGEKQKSKDDSDDTKKSKKKPAAKPEKDEPKEAAFRDRRMHKLADVLEDQYKQAEWAFEDVFSNLQRQLQRAHGAPSAETFEKDALALHGDAIGIVVLNMVKESQGLPMLEFADANAKTAALHDRHLVDETEANKLFATMVKIATEAARLKSGAEYARAQCS